MRASGDRLALVDTLSVRAPLDPYLSLRALAAYSGCSVRWLRDRLVDPEHPLPCYRLPGGKVLVRAGSFDVWLARYRQVGDARLDGLVDDLLKTL